MILAQTFVMPHPRALRVEQLDGAGCVIARFDSVHDAATQIGKPGGGGNINNVINGKAKSAYGFGWKRVTGDTPSFADEEWKTFEGIQVSSYGRISRAPPGDNLRVVSPHDFACKSRKNPVLMINGTQWLLHSLVAHVFLGMPTDGSVHARLKDGNPLNPHVDNIEIVAKKRARDEEDPVPESNPKAPRPVQQYTHDGKLLLNQYDSVADAARATKAVASHISRCASGCEKTAGGFQWKFLAA